MHKESIYDLYSIYSVCFCYWSYDRPNIGIARHLTDFKIILSFDTRWIWLPREWTSFKMLVSHVMLCECCTACFSYSFISMIVYIYIYSYGRSIFIVRREWRLVLSQQFGERLFVVHNSKQHVYSQKAEMCVVHFLVADIMYRDIILYDNWCWSHSVFSVYVHTS